MFERLLVAIDDSDSSLTALSFAMALARNSDADVYVLHVNPILVSGRGFSDPTQKEATHLVQRAVIEFRNYGIPATGLLARANMCDLPHAIVDAALLQGSDAIVMGSRQCRGLRRLLGRGIRDRVTSLSPLPILTAPPPLQIPGRRLFGLQRDPLLTNRFSTSFTR
ncbi:MAG TPA: universal stress protein [Acidimicrobiales bacterium]|nr:universal stress protein [Acidimicrobiales bacterium]